MIGRWAHVLGLVDHPNERSSHTHPTPRGGGAAIAIAVLASVTIGAARQTDGSHLVVWTLAAAGVAAVGLIDDLSSLPIRLRLLLQTAAAATVILYLRTLEDARGAGGGPVHLGWLGVPITAMWLVSLTNAFNFMDGIDGIAGTQAVVAGLGWTALGWMFGMPVAQLAGLALVGASLGFLYHGRPPARVFMGDVGSTFIGFTLAALAVISAPGSPIVPLMGLAFVWPFVFDSGFTLLTRLVRREDVCLGPPVASLSAPRSARLPTRRRLGALRCAGGPDGRRRALVGDWRPRWQPRRSSRRWCCRRAFRLYG